jgi:16S rRNA U1498 N3-methylase RsmE
MQQMSKQQTVVDWFIQQLQKTRDWQRVINEANQSGSSVRDVIKEAKEMEKDRLKDAFIEGANTIYAIPKTFDEWYNETYGGNK